MDQVITEASYTLTKQELISALSAPEKEKSMSDNSEPAFIRIDATVLHKIHDDFHELVQVAGLSREHRQAFENVLHIFSCVLSIAQRRTENEESDEKSAVKRILIEGLDELNDKQLALLYSAVALMKTDMSLPEIIQLFSDFKGPDEHILQLRKAVNEAIGFGQETVSFEGIKTFGGNV